VLLGIREIGIHDNFFELGGHSLLAIQLTARLRDAFQVEIPVHRIFEHATVAELAAAARAELPSPGAELERALAMVEGLSDEEVTRLLENSALPGERLDGR
jgi:acyl carrier protein